ncbi:MAG: UDP-glucose 4-epimerase GalE [Phycisphaerales bacterium]|nr:MAG: UDP-glucose 4-epimerase GalE [Phycisphaerales bacterium]
MAHAPERILVTGGAGFIGSHAALRLLEEGHLVTIVDDLSRGNSGAIEALRQVGPVAFVEGDIGDRDLMRQIMREQDTQCVWHFAALAYVGESVEQPLRYYRQNATASINLLSVMDELNIEKLVFSSTCATYGEPETNLIPIREDCPQQPINPYGRSKLLVEHAVRDLAIARHARGQSFHAAMLRYFNVAGSDPEGRLGEDHDPETHLIPICLEAVLGRRDSVKIFGTDYPTPDGTCIRDFVHVSDLIDAHLVAMRSLGASASDETVRAYNVGTGSGLSVREVVEACRAVTGVDFPVEEVARRPGDPPKLCADAGRIEAVLGWTAARPQIEQMVKDAWRWRQQHPFGFRSV